MNYWFLYNLSDGSFYGSPYFGPATEWTNIPGGCGVVGPFSATNSTAQNAYAYPNRYKVVSGTLTMSYPEEQQLIDTQSSKIQQLRNGYNNTLLSGFNATLESKSYTFGWSTDDKANLNATQTAVDRGYQDFPILYSDINGNPVTLTSQDDLNTIEETATKFAFAQHQQILNLVRQVQSVTDTTNGVATVNAIQWTPATY